MVNQSSNSRGFPAITGLNSFFLKKTEQINKLMYPKMQVFHRNTKLPGNVEVRLRSIENLGLKYIFDMLILIIRL